MNKEKKCCRCKQVKSIENFRKDNTSIDGYTYACKSCLETSVRKNKIKKMKTPEQRLEYLIQLVVRGEQFSDCANYFECSEEDILYALQDNVNYTYDSKWCPKCKQFKYLSYFSKDNHNSTGYKCWCKDCFNAYRSDEDIKLQIQKRSQEYYIENKTKINLQTKEYYDKTKEDREEYYKNYYFEHRHEQNARVAEYRANRLRAMPKWVDKNKIKAFYDEARKKTIETGIRYSVDHIFALKAEDSCGLHVPWNLQILPLSENCSKGNRNNHPSNKIIFEFDDDGCD